MHVKQNNVLIYIILQVNEWKQQHKRQANLKYQTRIYKNTYSVNKQEAYFIYHASFF